MSVEEAGRKGDRDIVRTVKCRFMQVFYLSGVVGDRNFLRWKLNDFCDCIHELDSIRRVADEGRVIDSIEAL
jgi:hypothetical protein